jgi:cytochrome c oxidase assembly protein subunit 15
MKLQRILASLAIVLTMLVIILGAYTRLTDAGLGCPDWPGCYGFLKVPQHETHVAVAEARFPERPLEAHKAWNEMVHRYFAGSLGLLIATIFFVSWRQQRKISLLPTALLSAWHVDSDAEFISAGGDGAFARWFQFALFTGDLSLATNSTPA